MSDASIEKTDWVLSELESMARGGDSDNLFYRRLIQALLPILRCQCVLLALKIESKPLVILRDGSSLDPATIEEGLSLAFPNDAMQQSNHLGARDNQRWITSRFPRSNPGQPMALLAHFETPLDSSQRSEAESLMAAFSEVCEVRELYVENSRSVGLWKNSVSRCQDLSNAQSHLQLHRGVVEGLRETLQADRVSFYIKRDPSSSMIACSGVASIDPNSTVVKELQASVGDLISDRQPKLWNSSDGSPQSPAYRLFLPWPSTPPVDEYGILVEWSDSTGMIERLQRASSLVPMLNHAWQNQNRWLHVPASIQEQTLRKAPASSHSKYLSKKALGLVGLAGLVGISMIPFPFYIQAPAYLEPIQQRFIHASADSFIEELLVNEGETVNPDQPLVQLRSPSLELQSQEALGQASALEEKRNGLRIAVNQLSSTPSDPSSQTRLSADLKLVEIQEKQAKEKVAFLKIQQGELLLKSPIQGVVVGGDLRRELNDRPLQRGDVLFRIAEIHGPWRLRLLVADRDGAYIQKALEQGPIPIDWGLENSTGKRLKATLNAIAKEVDQQPTLGPSRIAMADVDVQQIDQPVIGAVAYTRIACGRQPLWFIWSRPMVEFLQKRFWLVSPPSPIPLTET